MEALRLWAASVDFTKDMSIGPAILAQCTEAVRKIRNSARFILGNLRDRRPLPEERVGREEFSLVRICSFRDILLDKVLTADVQVERYMMHELYKLQQSAREGYAAYDFPRGL